MISAPDEDALNGLKVDVAGNLYAFGPEGSCILSTAGRHLGSAIPPKHRYNFVER
jgi:gluconolactonase